MTHKFQLIFSLFSLTNKQCNAGVDSAAGSLVVHRYHTTLVIRFCISDCTQRPHMSVAVLVVVVVVVTTIFFFAHQHKACRL